MKHLLSFVVICVVRLVAGLPKLHYFDDDNSALISQKSGWGPDVSDRNSEKIDEKLTPRANPKDKSSKGSQAVIAEKMPPPPSKQEIKAASTTFAEQAGADSVTQKHPKIVSQGLALQEPSVEQNSKAGIQPSFKQRSGNDAQPINNQKSKSGSKQQPTKDQALPSKKQNKADPVLKKQTTGRQLTSDRKQQKPLSSKQGALDGSLKKSNHEQQIGRNNIQPTRNSITIAETKKGRKALQKASFSDREHIESGTGPTGRNARIELTRGKNSPLVTKGSVNVKNAQQNGKRIGSDLRKTSKIVSPQRKRLCRRAGGRQSCTWDLEEGGRSLRDQPDTSKPDTAPSMISQMSRAGKDFARANPWSSATFGLGASSAFLGNVAGVTDQCCEPECAKSAAHALNYCGMTAGVAGAGIAFAGAVMAHQQRQKEKEEHMREIENLKMKTQGHDAAIEDHGRKIEQTNQRFSGELARTKQTLNQVGRRVGFPKILDDVL